ncbi:MAG: hypothetical protein ABL888_07145 [Pirellulaceae bacterium]
MAIVLLGPMVIPLPEGVDMSNPETMAENIKRLEAVNFIPIFLAHAFGSLVGAFVAAKIAAGHKMKFAIGIACFFLLGGIAMVSMYGGPLWFAILDLVGAYLPMGYLGGLLAGGKDSDRTLVNAS